MKKRIVIALSLITMLFITACKAESEALDQSTQIKGNTEQALVEGEQHQTDTKTKTEDEADSNTEEEALQKPEAKEGIKTGFGIVTSADQNSKDASDSNGLIQITTSLAAVLIDDTGIIQKCFLDMHDTKLEFNELGKVLTPASTVFQSYSELGDLHLNTLSDYITGKHLSEVKEISLDAEGYPLDEALASSITVSLRDIIKAIEKATQSAAYLGASSDDRLGIGITALQGSQAGTDLIQTQAYLHYVALTINSDNRITGSIYDAAESDVFISKDGKLASDLVNSFMTKLEKGEDYGMRGASPIGKEWFEQSIGFSELIKGKNVQEVLGLKLNSRSAPVDAASSATINVSYAMKSVKKAIDYAK